MTTVIKRLRQTGAIDRLEFMVYAWLVAMVCGFLNYVLAARLHGVSSQNVDKIWILSLALIVVNFASFFIACRLFFARWAHIDSSSEARPSWIRRTVIKLCLLSPLLSIYILLLSLLWPGNRKEKGQFGSRPLPRVVVGFVVWILVHIGYLIWGLRSGDLLVNFQASTPEYFIRSASWVRLEAFEKKIYSSINQGLNGSATEPTGGLIDSSQSSFGGLLQNSRSDKSLTASSASVSSLSNSGDISSLYQLTPNADLLLGLVWGNTLPVTWRPMAEVVKVHMLPYLNPVLRIFVEAVWDWRRTMVLSRLVEQINKKREYLRSKSFPVDGNSGPHPNPNPNPHPNINANTTAAQSDANATGSLQLQKTKAAWDAGLLPLPFVQIYLELNNRDPFLTTLMAYLAEMQTMQAQQAQGQLAANDAGNAGELVTDIMASISQPQQMSTTPQDQIANAYHMSLAILERWLKLADPQIAHKSVRNVISPTGMLYLFGNVEIPFLEASREMQRRLLARRIGGLVRTKISDIRAQFDQSRMSMDGNSFVRVRNELDTLFAISRRLEQTPLLAVE